MEQKSENATCGQYSLQTRLLLGFGLMVDPELHPINNIPTRKIKNKIFIDVGLNYMIL